MLTFTAASFLTPVPKSDMVATASSDFSVVVGGSNAPEHAVDGVADEGYPFHHSDNTFPYQWLQVILLCAHAGIPCLIALLKQGHGKKAWSDYCISI